MRLVALAVICLLSGPVVFGQRGARPAGPADGAQARARAGAAKLYDTSKLHHVDIVIAPQDVPKIPRRTDERVPCTFTFDGMTLKNVGVRQAGGVYRQYRPIGNKPTLSVKFDEFVKGQRLFDLDKLILKNEIDDPTFLREHTTYEIFRRAGLAASLTAYGQVTINGIDDGIYVLREPIENQFLIRNFGAGFETGNLYEIENVREFVTDPSYPKLDDEGKNGRNRQDLVRFANVIQHTSPASFVRDLSPILDIDRLITFLAAEMATWHWDGLEYRNNNTYMYDKPKEGKFIFFPYGADQTFGGSDGFPGWEREVPKSALARRLLAVPDLYTRYRQEILRVGREPVWNRQVLLARIDQAATVLRTAATTGRTGADVARFTSGRASFESLIRSGGRCSSEASLKDTTCR